MTSCSLSPDDVMDAFEEAGTTLSVLQTPANKVHARAFKLLTKLAGTVLDDEVSCHSSLLQLSVASHAAACAPA